MSTDFGTPGPPGTGESRPCCRGACSAIGAGRHARPNRACYGASRKCYGGYECGICRSATQRTSGRATAAHFGSGANQGGIVAAFPDFTHGNGSVQFVCKWNQQRRTAVSAGGGVHGGPRYGRRDAEPEHRRSHLSGAANFGRSASRCVSHDGPVGRHSFEFAEPFDPAADGDDFVKLENSQPHLRAGQADCFAARSGFSGAGRLFAAGRRGKFMALAAAT